MPPHTLRHATIDDATVLAELVNHAGEGMPLYLWDQMAEPGEGLSVIVSDANSGAHRLYERCGYRESGTRPMVKENWENDGQNWVLLTKSEVECPLLALSGRATCADECLL
jgi:hypothetical protein